MGIGIVDRKILWTKAANRCAFPECRQSLVYASEGGTVVGEEAHIVARTSDGPRGDDPLSHSERDRYSNLILLCPTHHTIVDKSRDDFPADLLRRMKTDHEAWVERQLGAQEPDPTELRYLTVVQGWEDRSIDSDWWRPLTSTLFTARKMILRAVLDDASACVLWLFNRRWPGTIPELEDALRLFEAVLGDLLSVYGSVLEFADDSLERMWFEPFYKAEGFNPRYDTDASEYRWIGDFVCDLGLELCRAANGVCDAVIDRLDPLYRNREGLVTVVCEDPVFGIESYRARYRAADRPYTDLRDFAELRESRDVNIGSGFDAGAARRLGISP